MEMKTFEVTPEEEAELKSADVELEAALEPEPVKEEPKPEVVKEESKVDAKTEIKKNLTKEQEIISNLNAALRETREELKGFKSKLSTVDELKKALLARQQEEERKNFVPPPDPAIDPLGAQQYQLNQITAQQQELLNNFNQAKVDAQSQGFIMHVRAKEDEFRAKQPDYNNALEYVADIRKQELADFGITDPDEIAKDFFYRASSISNDALQRGLNPAEVVYNMAKRYGYKPSVATPVAEPAVAAQQRLEVVQQGQQKAGKTLSGAGETETNATIDALLKAKGTEFDKLWNEMFEK